MGLLPVSQPAAVQVRRRADAWMREAERGPQGDSVRSVHRPPFSRGESPNECSVVMRPRPFSFGLGVLMGSFVCVLLSIWDRGELPHSFPTASHTRLHHHQQPHAPGSRGPARATPTPSLRQVVWLVAVTADSRVTWSGRCRCWKTLEVEVEMRRRPDSRPHSPCMWGRPVGKSSLLAPPSTAVWRTCWLVQFAEVVL